MSCLKCGLGRGWVGGNDALKKCVRSRGVYYANFSHFWSKAQKQCEMSTDKIKLNEINPEGEEPTNFRSGLPAGSYRMKLAMREESILSVRH